MTISQDELKKEWLQLLEFIKRKQGEPRADFIKRRDYNTRNNQSVSEFYDQPTRTLKQLLTDPTFLANVLGEDSTNVASDVSNFAEIYSKTNDLLNSIDTTDNEIYIKCNPVDENSNSIIEPTNNSFGSSVSSINSMFDELGNSINPMMLYNNIGLQAFIIVLFFAIVYYIGKYMFLDYPKNVISKRI